MECTLTKELKTRPFTKYAQGDRKVVVLKQVQDLIFSIGVSREMCSFDVQTLSENISG